MKEKTKKFYKKPQMEQINLVPEEATLGFCKQVGTGSTGVGSNQCVTAPCKSPGS